MKLIKSNIPFTMVANEVLRSKTLSWKAKGLYAYLFSKPDDWDFAGDRIVEEGLDKRHAVFSALKELETGGYLKRQRHPSGRVEYHLMFSDKPTDENQQEAQKPLADNRKVRKPQSAEISSVSNTDTKSNKEEKVILAAKAAGTIEGDQWNILIDGFETINPMYKFFYSNRTERSALEAMVTMIGFEKLKATIDHLPEIIAQPYAPKITRPTELKRDFGKLIAFYNQSRSKPTTAKAGAGRTI